MIVGGAVCLGPAKACLQIHLFTYILDEVRQQGIGLSWNDTELIWQTGESHLIPSTLPTMQHMFRF